MRPVVFIFALLFMSCPLPGQTAPNTATIPEPPALTWPAGLPVYDHIIIVVEENKDYEEIIGHANAPYINNLLKKEGANFTQMYGEEHYSQGNYFWMFSGDNQTIGFTDQVPLQKLIPNIPSQPPIWVSS